MSEKVKIGIRSFFIAIALTCKFHEPLGMTLFENKIDYVIASIYELLGDYNVEFIFVWILAGTFMFFAQKSIVKKNTSVGLAVFYSLCMVMGKSYFETSSSVYIFGSAVNLIKSVLAFVGYSYLFYAIIGLVFAWIAKSTILENDKGFLKNHTFLKSFIVLCIVYGVVVLISYPGTLCYDVIGQIEQVTKESGYSAHHPLGHTLLVGGLTKLGDVLFGSYEIGLFVYMLVQMVMLVAAFSATIAVLANRGVNARYLMILLVIYCITPLYSNIVSVAIKDVPYCAFVIGYVICFVMLLEKPEKIREKKFVLFFILLQIGTILFRNNGLVLVLISGLVAFFYFFGKYTFKERVQYILGAFAIGIIVSKMILFILMRVTNAGEGSSGEMLSIPFQQTARYLQLYQNELTIEEREAIETVLGPVDVVAAAYNPMISDDVKALFNKEASLKDVTKYIEVWARCFFKHPTVYIEAFFVHTYGWFTPVATNAIRYETDYAEISQQGLFPNAQKYLVFMYRYLNRIPVLGILENIGAYVWAMFFFIFYNLKTKKKMYVYATLPLIVSLLVCMASPCYIWHPRYGMPIISTLPFLYGFRLSEKEEKV